MVSLTAKSGQPLRGVVTVPGDKSVSHRSLIVSSQALGVSRIYGLLEGEDVINTAHALEKLGVVISRKSDCWEVQGVGVGGLKAPSDIIDMGNSGTGVRLLMGLTASYNFPIFFTGDKSLRKRPMARVLNPLKEMGLNYIATHDNLLPLVVQGSDKLLPLEYTLPVASAQVKSAILLAALNVKGTTRIIEPIISRDHTEIMLKNFGANISVKPHGQGRVIELQGYPELKAKDVYVPGDPSSAAFLIVAALIIPGSDITIKDICINPLRTGLFTVLRNMGANIEFSNKRLSGGEEVADIKVKYSKLKAVTVPKELAPSMIDEYPILAIAASFAQGTSKMEGLEELRVKESDRLSAILEGLKNCGVLASGTEDSMEITGGKVIGGGRVATHMDHRIAMSFLILGLASEKDVTIDDSEMIKTSFPNFIALMQSLGANIQ